MAAALALLLVAQPALAAELQHASAVQTTNQTTTSSTFGTITGTSIASGGFTTGKKYLLLASGQIDEDSSGLVGIQAIHGSTAFAESMALVTTGTNGWWPWGWFTVWTAVSGEGVALQGRVTAGNGNFDQLSVLAMKLSDDLVEGTDWCFAERTNDDSLGTGFTGGASCTVTPSGASDWLVLTYAQFDITVGGDYVTTRINHSGSSTTPAAIQSTGATTAQFVIPLARVYTLGAASNTFTEESASEGTSNTRLHSAIFVLNLNRFRNRAWSYTDSATALSTTNFATQLESINLTPDVQGDVWTLGSWVYDLNSVSALTRTRLQIDNSDAPGTQTSDAYTLRNNDPTTATDELAIWLPATFTNLTAAAHTVDLDASSTNSGPDGKYRLLMAVTLELAASSPTCSGARLALTGVGC